jgi:hypothetical protein
MHIIRGRLQRGTIARPSICRRHLADECFQLQYHHDCLCTSASCCNSWQSKVGYSVGHVLQLSSLVNRTSGGPQPGREKLVNHLRWDTLRALREFCLSAGKAKPFCSAPDPVTFLPTGLSFHQAVWDMLRSEFDGTSPLSGSVCFPLFDWLQSLIIAEATSAVQRVSCLFLLQFDFQGNQCHW